MALEVRWSPEADLTFSEIIKYLEQSWTEKEVQVFVLKTLKIIKQVSKHPKMFRSSGVEKVSYYKTKQLV